tara:strand:+ start:735 stop:1178 length:444 start_codon:yes stop_codon:yes gene_type:complete
VARQPKGVHYSGLHTLVTIVRSHCKVDADTMWEGLNHLPSVTNSRGAFAPMLDTVVRKTFLDKTFSAVQIASQQDDIEHGVFHWLQWEASMIEIAILLLSFGSNRVSIDKESVLTCLVAVLKFAAQLARRPVKRSKQETSFAILLCN